MEDVSETPKDNIEEMEHSNKLTLNPKTGLMSDGSKVRIFNQGLKSCFLQSSRKPNYYFSYFIIYLYIKFKPMNFFQPVWMSHKKFKTLQMKSKGRKDKFGAVLEGLGPHRKFLRAKKKNWRKK